MVKLPKTYRSITLELDIGEEEPLKVEVRGYRPTDIDLASEIQEIRHQLPLMASKLNMVKDIQKKIFAKAKKSRKQISQAEVEKLALEEFNNMSMEDLSDEDLKELQGALKEKDRINKELEKVATTLGQRGAKRFFYRDEKEFQEAESQNRGTEYIDKLPDIELDIDNLRKIAFTMLDLSAPSSELQEKLENKSKEDDKGK